MAWFYEIRDSNNILMKRDGGFATQDDAKFAVRADAKKIKKSRQPNMPASAGRPAGAGRRGWRMGMQALLTAGKPATHCGKAADRADVVTMLVGQTSQMPA